MAFYHSLNGVEWATKMEAGQIFLKSNGVNLGKGPGKERAYSSEAKKRCRLAEQRLMYTVLEDSGHDSPVQLWLEK